MLIDLSVAVLLAAPAAAPPVVLDVPRMVVDTPAPAPRVRAVEVGEWYSRRLTLHRRLSYAVVPLFAFQYAAGRQLWEKGSTAPTWARRGHPAGAAAIGGVFVANIVTGAWNLWDSREIEDGRARRYLHAASMAVASAGFTWAGAVLSEQAERSLEKRRLHRTVALTSMGITVTSGVLMKLLNR